MERGTEEKIKNSLSNDIDVDLRDIIITLWNSKIFISAFVFIFAISSVFLSLSLTNIYKSDALLKIVEDNNKSSDLASNYGGLASLAGIDIGSGASSDRGDYAIKIIQSREFLKHLLKFDDVLPQLMAAQEFDTSKRETIFDPNIYDANKMIWVRAPSKNYKTVPTYLEVHEDYIGEYLTIEKDTKTGFISISVSHLSPDFAHYFLNLIISEANNIVRLKDLKSSKDSLDYLNNQLVVNKKSELKSAISKLIESQLNIQMLSNIRSEYLLEYLDKPFIPEKKYSPNRSLICIFGTFFGFILSSIIVLFRKYFYI